MNIKKNYSVIMICFIIATACFHFETAYRPASAEELFTLAIEGPLKVTQNEKFKLKTYPEGLSGGKAGNIDFNWYFKGKKIKTGNEIELMFKNAGSYELKVEAAKKIKSEKETSEVLASKIFSIAAFPSETNTGAIKIKYNEVETIKFGSDGSCEIAMKSGSKFSVSDKYQKNSDLKISRIYSFENLDTSESYIFKLDSAGEINEATIEIAVSEIDAGEISVFAVLPENGEHVPLSFESKKSGAEVLIQVPAGSKSPNGGLLFNNGGPYKFNGHIIAISYGTFSPIECRQLFAFDETAEINLKSGSKLELKNGSKTPAAIIITESESLPVKNAPKQKLFTIKSSEFLSGAKLKIKLEKNLNPKYITSVYAVPDGDTAFFEPEFDTAEGLLTLNTSGGKRKYDINTPKKRSKGGSGQMPGGNSAIQTNDLTADFEAGATFVIEYGGEPKTVPAAKIIELPYYEQGASGCCWAAAALMFIKSYLAQGYSDTAIYEILKGMRLNKDDGIGGAWSSDMKRLGARVKGYTGIKTETLTFFNYHNFINYVIARLSENKPVIVNMGLHQGMFVGYEMNGPELNQINIIYHDPQNSNEKTPAQGPYRKVSAEKLCAEFTPTLAKSINITICAGEPVSASAKTLQTFHMPDSLDGNITMSITGGAGIVKQYGKRKLIADYVTWDIASKNGYKFKTGGNEIPPADEFIINAVPIWNTDRNNDANCTIKTYIKKVKDGCISGPVLLETGEVKITIPKFDVSAAPDSTGNHPARFLYKNSLKLSDIALKLTGVDHEFAFINELLDNSGKLIGMFVIYFDYSPLLIFPAKVEKLSPGESITFKAEILGTRADCDFSVSDKENFSIDGNGILKFTKEPGDKIEKIFVTATEKNDNPAAITIGTDRVKLLKTATAEIILAAQPAKTEKLEITPAARDIAPGAKIQFKALSDGSETGEINWKITKAQSLLCEPGKGTQVIDYYDIAASESKEWGKISAGGLYEAPEKAPDCDLEVIALLKGNEKSKAIAKVNFIPFKILIDDTKLEVEQNHKYEVEISTYNVLPENYSIKYDFGDGTPSETVKNSRLEHKYEKSGTFDIKAGLYDASGKLIIEDTRKITVKESGKKTYRTYYSETDSDEEQKIKEEYEGYEKDGKIYKHGKYRTYSKTGKLTSEGNYINDSREGKWVVYSRKGSTDEYYLSYVYNRKNDIREGQSTDYYPDGTKKEELTWANDKPNGPFVKYHENGKKFEEGTYKDSYKEGRYVKWYDTGIKAEEGEYQGRDNAFEKRSGTWTYWRKDGSIKEKAVYENDKVKEYMINNN